MTATLRVEIPEALGFLYEPSRYKVAYGGRGGAKSWGIARVLIAKAYAEPLRILCARELQLSIQESVHKLLSDQIHALGLDAAFDIQRATIKGANGSEFVFSGIKSDPNKIKSMEGVDICWVEEAAKVSEESWQTLIPTIRKPGSEIWVSFNPEEETDPTFQRFVVNTPPGAVVRCISWSDNPWFPEELHKEMDYLYSVDPDAAAHVWGGACRKVTDAQVLRGKYVVQEFTPRPDLWDGPYQGADWGFATDPTALVRVWLWERKLYVEHEAYGLQTEIDHTPALFDGIPNAREYVTRADSSRPETISFLVRAGFRNMQPAFKWKGSVEDGVQWLRAMEQIVIHPRCRHTAEEARLWSFKTDRLSGDVLPELVDKHNHTWDAIRYALEPVILNAASKRPPKRPDPLSDEFPGMYPGRASWMG